MKNGLMILICAMSLHAYASDQMVTEVTCNKIVKSGEFDNGLTILLQSNPTAWTKLVTVIENGYIGNYVIANIQVPLAPEVRPGARGYIPEVNLVYVGAGIELSLAALRFDKFPLTGLGSAKLNLPGRAPETVQLNCEPNK